MCDKGISENGGTLKSIPNCYKNQKMCNKEVDNYPHALEFVLKCYKTQELCDKTLNKSAFIYLQYYFWRSFFNKICS